MRHIRIIIFWLVITQFSPLFAQTNASLQHYTDENGLPQNSVTQLAFDNAGFLWFATNSGLVRFDGHHFEILEKDHLGISDQVIQYFAVDPQSELLLAANRIGNVGVISNGKFRRLDHVKVPEKGYFPGSPLLKYFQGKALPYAFNRGAYSYIIPAGSNFYYTLFDDSLKSFRNGEVDFTTKLSIGRTELWRFFVINRKLYYVGTRGEIKQFEKNVKNISPKGDLAKDQNYGRSGNEIRPIVNAATGDVFIYLESSLYKVEADSASGLSTRLVLTGFDFSDHAISTVCYDKTNGRLFLGSYTDGLFVFSPKEFKALSYDEYIGGATGNSYSAQVEYSKDKILTAEGNIFNLQGAEDFISDFTNYSDRGSLLKDYRGNIWSKRLYDLYQWNDKGDITKSYKFNRIISVIYAGIDSCIWVGTKTPGGLYRLDIKSENPQPELIIESIPDVTYIAQNRKDAIWLGTVSGLYALNKYSGKIHPVKELKKKTINSIYADNSNKNNVWILVEEDGLYLNRNGISFLMPLDAKGNLTDGRCMLRDSSGYFWITTGKGLFRILESDLIDYADQKRDRVYYSYYGKSKGFNTNEFNGFCEPCGIELNNGYFSFPSLNGLVSFNPSKIKSEFPNKSIYIDRVTMDGELIFADSNTYRLKRDFKKVLIHYTTPYFGNINNLNFETKIDDEDWQISNSNEIIFTSLPAGKHKLYIRKLCGSGEDFSVKMIELEMPPAYWQTWWFVVLCIFVFIVIIYSYTKLRVLYIKRRNLFLEESITERTQELKQTITALKESKDIISRDAELQKRLTASIAHDVKTPLKYLLLTAGSLSKIPPEQLSNEQDTIRTVHQSLYRIYHFTDNLLAYIKSRFNDAETSANVQINLNDVIQEKIEIFRDIAKSQSTTIKNLVAEDIFVHSNRNLISVIIHNLIDNAVKFTFNGEIIVSGKRVEDEVVFTIKDTGVGIYAEQLESIQLFFESDELRWNPGYNKHNGLGLVIIKEIVKQLDGKIAIDSEKDMGTTFMVSLPIS